MIDQENKDKFLKLADLAFIWLIIDKDGGVKMPFLAKGIMVFGKHNKYKLHLFQSKEKAQRFWLKCKRLGLDAQLVY